MEDDLLDKLLAAATDELESKEKSKETQPKHTSDSKCAEDSFSKAISSIGQTKRTNKNLTASKKNNSTIHNGDTDSSDDEYNRDFENRRYSEYGKNIKQLLESSEPKSSDSITETATTSPVTWKTPKKVANVLNKTPNERVKSDVYSDPVFGIRIVNPLISSVTLKNLMVGREAVYTARVQSYTKKLTPGVDWAIGGVIVHKGVMKTSQSGKQYMIWTLSDLHGDLKTLALFLFSNACKKLWKTVVGTVIGVLNPSVLEKREGSKDEACLSVNNSEQVLILGQSKDLGTCKSMKISGTPCTAFVNTNRCEYCIYHVKQEYQKCSKRQALQSGFSGGGLTALRNKVLGKNEVFYAGKMYAAIPAKKNRKQLEKDENRLRTLSGSKVRVASVVNQSAKLKYAARLDVPKNQRLKDLKRLEMLSSNLGDSSDSSAKGNFSASMSDSVTAEEAKSAALNVINKLKQNKNSAEVAPTESRSTALDVITNLNLKPTEITHHSTHTRPSSVENEVDLNVDFRSINKTDQGLGNIRSELDNENRLIDTVSNPKSIITEETLPSPSCNKQATNREDYLEAVSTTSSSLPRMQNKTKSLASSLTPALLKNVPVLMATKEIDLSSPAYQKRIDKAKLNAIKWVQKNGKIQKADPNKVKSSSVKRSLEAVDTTNPMDEAKRQKIAENEFFSERFKKMMAASSVNQHLLENVEDEEQEKYFRKLEIKEQMEEKMLTTYKIACKAVKCLKCKYTNFSASEHCKTERHPLRVFDAVKRFFKCGGCGNRTVCLEVVPLHGCKNCGSGKWQKTSMMKEQRIEVSTHKLSIRGGEQTFVNSVASNGNLDLMVPDE